jgi:hypothetical protein
MFCLEHEHSTERIIATFNETLLHSGSIYMEENMATLSPDRRDSIANWLMRDPNKTHAHEGHEHETSGHEQHPWYKVKCLTGVDYYSSVGYQPSIAVQAAMMMGTGALAPIATLWLVLLTVFGARPMYQQVAEESPHGDGSLSMIERMIAHWGWRGKLVMLGLFSFAVMCFVLTMSLSSADAAKHIIENQYVKSFFGFKGDETFVLVGITEVLLAALGGVFLKGFKEAVGIAVALVVTYLSLSMVVIIWGASILIFQRHDLLTNWQASLMLTFGSPLAAGGAGLLLFPRLALGLSGFETGVLLMPLVKGDRADTEAHPRGRIRNSKKLLTAAALIMSVVLVGSNFVSAILIPQEAFLEHGPAAGRALAYVAHEFIGSIFGTVNDVSTILILWFAGASAMAGLIYITPRYLPRYGMAPEWAQAVRPLVLVFIGIAMLVTLIFKANVESQAGAYASGVLALIFSASVAVTFSAHRRRKFGQMIGFGLVSLIFLYTWAFNIYEKPEGILIAFVFFIVIIVLSAISRKWRSSELRIKEVRFSQEAQDLIPVFITTSNGGSKKKARIILKRPNGDSQRDLQAKYDATLRGHNIPLNRTIPFLSLKKVRDPSDFIQDVLDVHMTKIGEFFAFHAETNSVSNGIAAVLIEFALSYGCDIIHANFEMTSEDPMLNDLEHVMWGDGATAQKVLQIINKAKRCDPRLRHVEFWIHAAGCV